VKELETAQESETDRLKREAAEGKDAATTGTAKLRKANLLLSLANSGLTGAKAKAAAKLIEGVKYNADDEPENLEERIKAAKAEYGSDLFGSEDTPADPANGNGNGAPAMPDTHPGPQQASGQDEAELMKGYIDMHFPQIAETP
jgi:hypothetical protein